MTKFWFTFLGFFGIATTAHAQQDSIVSIPEIVISDTFLTKVGVQKQVKISDSIARTSSAFLSDVLKNNTLIHFKENGNGMVASPTFRGTSAQQTAVIWNGININSQLNGQTDFNTIASYGYNEIAVKAGGGSAIYGSSAIGGSVHLQNTFDFKPRFSNEILVKAGSFATQQYFYQTQYATQKLHLQASFLQNSSDNDYPIKPSNRDNINGQYHVLNYQLNAGYKLSPQNVLKFFGEYLNSDRHFSVLFKNETRTKYQDDNLRLMSEWEMKNKILTSRFKLGYFSEHYRYFKNITSDVYTQNKVGTAFAKWEADWNINTSIQVSTIVDASQNTGLGSDIVSSQREQAGLAVLLKHKWQSNLQYEVSLRKDYSSVYQNPLLYSLGLQWQSAAWHEVKLNFAKNFRVPTFNDLYWNPGGNLSIIPETSHQLEVGNYFNWSSVSFDFQVYYNRISDMILWKPTSSLWAAINVDEVESYGIEAGLSYPFSVRMVNFKLRSQLGFTKTEDQVTQKQLIYTPKTKALLQLDASWKSFFLQIQASHTGEAFTRTDNAQAGRLSSYELCNITFSYSPQWFQHSSIGATLHNIFDQQYASMEDRWMPGAHYTFFINLKF